MNFVDVGADVLAAACLDGSTRASFTFSVLPTLVMSFCSHLLHSAPRFSRMSTLLSLCPSGYQRFRKLPPPGATLSQQEYVGNWSRFPLRGGYLHEALCVLLEWTTGQSLTANSSSLDDPPSLPHSPQPPTSISFEISPNKQLAPKFSSLTLYFGAAQTKIWSRVWLRRNHHFSPLLEFLKL